MATSLLTTASTLANSADITVAAGSSVTVCMRDQVDANALINIMLKDEAGAYLKVGELTASRPAQAISAPGVYRLTRPAGSSCGAFSG